VYHKKPASSSMILREYYTLDRKKLYGNFEKHILEKPEVEAQITAVALQKKILLMRKK
jgi:hypothetical protein